MQYMVSKYWKVAIFNDYECSYGKSRLSLKLSEDGRYLTSNRHTHPPYRYWVRLVLLHESNSDNNLVFSRTQFSQ